MAARKRAPAQEDSPRAKTARSPASKPRPRGSARGPRGTPARGGSARGSRRASTRGCLFWLVLLAVVVAVAFAAREPLTQAFRRFASRGAGGEAAAAQQPERPPAEANPPAPSAGDPSPAKPGPSPAAASPPAPKPERPAPAAAKPAPAKPAPARPADQPLRRARVYFLAPGQDGSPAVTPVDREIPQSDSPLRDALESLLSGPDAKDKAKGMWTVIPPETRLRSVAVRDGVAFVDLSESFRFTAGGVEGLEAELGQVVATATQFPTVRKVQILIEGRRVRYLGTEGVRIDEPLAPR